MLTKLISIKHTQHWAVLQQPTMIVSMWLLQVQQHTAMVLLEVKDFCVTDQGKEQWVGLLLGLLRALQIQNSELVYSIRKVHL